MRKVLKSGSILLGIVSILSIAGVKNANAQASGTITVNGDISKYYPVTFKDAAAPSDLATEVEIGRSNVHRDSSWRGSLIAKFRYHVNNWGMGSEFIDADIRGANSHVPANSTFIAGWTDASFGNNTANIIIWLRGKTTYTYRSDYPVSPVVYDGVQNPASYTPTAGGVTYSARSAVDDIINIYGSTYGNTAYFNGVGTNYFGGNLGIGTRNTGTSKLAVEGTIAARRVKVTQATTWPDFVFDAEYKLPSLQEVEAYIKANKHLPDVPSAEEVAKDGQDVGEMNRILLQKVEELTLHVIEQEKELNSLRERIKAVESK
ncbi:hypothetical protein L3C95_21195 [Chitinophaga filiformis]|uniref:hypothetical protein n=1 Tax=Chitinophaga filiformis TaxID=104663 RepID=UPI001F332C0B|nr:hypothetical protein [Chitinophaga filiformis]MCF6405435.1 hypothetical protein [Chitinophaga filiformis]